MLVSSCPELSESMQPALLVVPLAQRDDGSVDQLYFLANGELRLLMLINRSHASIFHAQADDNADCYISSAAWIQTGV